MKRRFPWIIAALVGVFLSTSALGVNMQFLRNDPIGHLTEEDWKLAKATFECATDSNPDGTTSTWRNLDTGAWGTVTPLNSYENEKGLRCRTVVTRDHVNELSNRYKFDFCKDSKGTWRIQTK